MGMIRNLGRQEVQRTGLILTMDHVNITNILFECHSHSEVFNLQRTYPNLCWHQFSITNNNSMTGFTLPVMQSDNI